MNNGKNILREFFYNRNVGLGIWKWDHYFDIYERHFRRFCDTDVTVAEIGIYSGGSLDMWQYYFGTRARIIGIDVQPDCRIYERDGVSVYIGDQSDKGFWKDFRAAEPTIDILIDDGSHKYKHQLLTYTEMFPHIQAGGVYMCEDIHGYPDNRFAEYMNELSKHLHVHDGFRRDPDGNLLKKTTEIQSNIKSISFYPYACVIEKNDSLVEEFVAPRQGDQWQPFRP